MLAALWGLVAGSALLIGAAISWFVQLDKRVVASVMAFGAGILISAVAFDIMDDAFRTGGLAATVVGFLLGALIFTGGAVLISRAGGRHRKRSIVVDARARGSGGLAIALGTAIDGVPESILIGVSLIDGRGVALAAVVAIFLSNIPEALSSTAGMKRAGRSAAYVFTLWAAIAVSSGVFALVGYFVFARFPPEVVAITQSIAGGALVAMIADTMIPEAFAEAHDAVGLITALGFAAGFALSHGLA